MREKWLTRELSITFTDKELINSATTLCSNYVAMKDQLKENDIGKYLTFVVLLAKMDKLSKTVEEKG